MASFIPSKDSQQDFEKCIKVNVMGTLNLLEFAFKKNVTSFVYSSSASVYGSWGKLPVDESTPPQPKSFYGISKLMSEILCKKYSEDFGLNCACLRYSSVYGHIQRKDSVLPIFINQAIKNKKMTIHGRGARSQDFVYVKDVVRANVLAAQKNACGIFDIGSNQETTMTQLAKMIKKIFKSKSKIVFDTSIEEGPRFYLDISKAQKELSFSPRYSLEDGLKDYKKVRALNERY